MKRTYYYTTSAEDAQTEATLLHAVQCARVLLAEQGDAVEVKTVPPIVSAMDDENDENSVYLMVALEVKTCDRVAGV